MHMKELPPLYSQHLNLSGLKPDKMTVEIVEEYAVEVRGNPKQVTENSKDLKSMNSWILPEDTNPKKLKAFWRDEILTVITEKLPQSQLAKEPKLIEIDCTVTEGLLKSVEKVICNLPKTDLEATVKTTEHTYSYYLHFPGAKPGDFKVELEYDKAGLLLTWQNEKEKLVKKFAIFPEAVDVNNIRGFYVGGLLVVSVIKRPWPNRRKIEIIVQEGVRLNNAQ